LRIIAKKKKVYDGAGASGGGTALRFKSEINLRAKGFPLYTKFIHVACLPVKKAPRPEPYPTALQRGVQRRRGERIYIYIHISFFFPSSSLSLHLDPLSFSSALSLALSAADSRGSPW